MIKITLVTNNPRKTDIVPETMTVRQLLEKHEINYALASTAIDGCTLRPGDMDKPLIELLGENCERATVSCLANKDNGATAVIAGSSCIIKSELTPEQIKRIKKFHPEALTMVDEDDEPVYAMDICDGTPGSINKNGACFGSATSADGKATITVLLDPEVEDTETFVYEKLGSALAYLKDMEENLIAILPQLDEEEQEVRAMISRI